MATYWGYDPNRTPNYGRWIDEPVPGRYDARDFTARQGPLTASTHGQSPWRGLTGATNAEFRPGSVASRLGTLGRFGLGPASLLGGLLAQSPDAGRGSDLTGMDPGYGLEDMVDPTWQAEDDLINDANRGWGLTPGTQVLGGNNPFISMGMTGMTPMSTSSYRAAPVSFGGFGRGSGRNVPAGSQDFPAISMANVLGNVEANRRGEMVDPTWSGPFATTAGSVGLVAALRGLVSDANAVDFANATTGFTQASPGSELAAQEAMASMGLSPTPVGSSRGHHPGQGDLEAALANTGNLMSPGQYAQQHFGKTDSLVDQIMSGVISGLRSTSGTRTTEQQRIDAFKSALNNQRALAEDTDATAAIAAQIAAQDAAVAAYGEDQAGQNTYGQASTGWAPGQALTTMDLLGNVVDVTLENDPVSVAIANARKSALANPDINVAATVAEQVAQTEAMLGSMGLTGATAQAAQQAMTASSGYITPDQIAGLVAAQQEQDRAEAAANAAAAAIAASYSEAQDYGGEDEADPADTMAGFGTVTDAEVEAVMAQIVADALEAEDPMSSRYGAHYGGGEEGYGGGFGAPGGSGGGGGYEV